MTPTGADRRPHGSYVKYVVEQCRCGECREANRLYEQARARRVAPAYVDADRARAHIEELRAAGLGAKAIASAAGISHGAISKLIYGDYRRGTPPSRRIRQDTEHRILGVTPRDGADRSLIDGTATRRNIAELLHRGWTKTSIARALGLTTPLQVGLSQRVRAGRARAIEALLDEPVPPRRSRWGATPVDPPAEDRDALKAQAKRSDNIARYLPQGNAMPGEWVDDALCRRMPDAPTWLFFPSDTDTETIARAKDICARCPVRAECLDHALATDADGIWGGLTTSERATLTEAES